MKYKVIKEKNVTVNITQWRSEKKRNSRLAHSFPLSVGTLFMKN